MKQTRNILGWLGVEEGNRVLVIAEQHSEETCRTVACLWDAVKALSARDTAGRMEAVQRVKDSERAADKLLAKMVTQLSEGMILPPNREDFIRFANALDKIADSTNRAARLLAFIERQLPENIVISISQSAQLVVEAVTRLRGAVSAARAKDFTTAMAECLEVERFEHEADDQKRSLIDALLHANLTPGDLLITYHLAEALEVVTDRIEAASDMIKLLILKGQ